MAITLGWTEFVGLWSREGTRPNVPLATERAYLSHATQVCHRDLKLENTLLNGSPAPRRRRHERNTWKKETH